MTKIDAKSWSIIYVKPSFDFDKTPYCASYEYTENGDSHDVSKWFKTYQAAYGYLAEHIIL